MSARRTRRLAEARPRGRRVSRGRRRGGKARAAAADADAVVLPAAPARRPLFRVALWAVPITLAVLVVGLVMLTRSRAGVLTEQDMVLLAFENLTGDAVFDETIPLAMSIQLEQSPYLALLSADHVQETLRMMRRPPDTPITRAIGLEVCERVGARAIIVTSIAPLGTRYAIGLEAMECTAGRKVLTRRQEVVDTKERILDGVQRGAEAIRQAVGESAASVRQYGTPAAQATTVSLEALEASRLEPKSPAPKVTLGRTYLYMNRLAEARKTAEDGLAAGGTSPTLHFVLFQCGLATGDAELIARERAWGREHPSLAVHYIVDAEAEDAMSRGTG